MNILPEKTLTVFLTLLLSSAILSHVNSIQMGHRELPCEDECARGKHEKMSHTEGITMGAILGGVFVLIVCCACATCINASRGSITTNRIREPLLNQGLFTTNNSSNSHPTSELTSAVSSRHVSTDANGSNGSKLTSSIEADNGLGDFNC